MSGRKSLLLIGFSFGAGFAVVMLMGGFVWYESRPKPWNHDVIKASFDSVEDFADLGAVPPQGGTARQEGTSVPSFDRFMRHVEFHYTLENKLDGEYRLTESEYVSMLSKWKLAS